MNVNDYPSSAAVIEFGVRRTDLWHTPHLTPLNSSMNLKKSGIPEKQARALAAAVRKAHESSDLATKADLRELELRLSGEMKLLKWILGFIAAGVASLVLKAFF